MADIIGSFTASDLLKYAESLLKDARLLELKSENQSNYSWLNTKHVSQGGVDVYLERFKPMILKMSSESCTAVAVKLDILTELSTSTDHILTTLNKLLQEQDSMNIMAGNVKRAKETNKRKVKVQPVLEGRTATVSFLVHDNKI